MNENQNEQKDVSFRLTTKGSSAMQWAISGLVVAIVSFFIDFSGLFKLLAIISGLIAFFKGNRSGEKKASVLGLMGTVLALISYALTSLEF